MYSYFRRLKAEPTILGHALSKVEVSQGKKNMSSDSQLQSSVNSVECFDEPGTSEEEMSIVTVTAQTIRFMVQKFNFLKCYHVKYDRIF